MKEGHVTLKIPIGPPFLVYQGKAPQKRVAVEKDGVCSHAYAPVLGPINYSSFRLAPLVYKSLLGMSLDQSFDQKIKFWFIFPPQ